MLTWELPSANVMTSSCAGEVTAELMLMLLMMKSGLYHHPAGIPCPSAHAFASCTDSNPACKACSILATENNVSAGGTNWAERYDPQGKQV